MNELALFAGAGGGILGGKLLGWRTICAVEINAFCARRLMQRQNEGHFPPFPIWDDVCSFDGRPWKGIIDVVSGGFPCQNISAAGDGTGIDGEKSGLWREFKRIIGDVEPAHVLVENSPILTIRGLGTILRDFSEMGYAARWGSFFATDAIWIDGVPVFDHLRERIFIKATHPYRVPKLQQKGGECDERRRIIHRFKEASNALRYGHRKQETSEEFQDNKNGNNETSEFGWNRVTSEVGSTNRSWWASEPGVGRVVHGVAHRNDRFKAIGNGQVPAVVKLAWETLSV